LDDNDAIIIGTGPQRERDRVDHG